MHQPYRGPGGHGGGDQSFHSYGPETATQPMVTKKPLKPLYKPPYFFANSASFIVCLGGVIFFFLGFGGPAWYVVPPEDTVVPKTFGVWRLCVRSECVVEMTNDYMVKRYLVFEDKLKRTTNPGTGEVGNNMGLKCWEKLWFSYHFLF